MPPRVLYPTIVNLALAALLLGAIWLRGIDTIVQALLLLIVFLFGFLRVESHLNRFPAHYKYADPWIMHFLAQLPALVIVALVVADVLVWRHAAGIWTVIVLGMFAGHRLAIAHDGVFRSS